MTLSPPENAILAVTQSMAECGSRNPAPDSSCGRSEGSGTDNLGQTATNSVGTSSLSKSSSEQQSWQQTGDDDTGSYSGSGTDNVSTTIQDTTTTLAGQASYTETSQSNSTLAESGDDFTGAYTRNTSSSGTTTLQDSAGGVGTNESDSQTSTRQESGDNFTGSYTAQLTSSDNYGMTQTAGGSDSFSLTESGSATSSGQESGNSVTGAYSRGLSGDDSYAMAESGQSLGGSYSATLQGSETTSVSETGNTPDQTFQRTESGNGSYNLTDSGPGATMPSGVGSNSYSLQESGDWKSGSLSQSETGQDRYSLLQGFANVSNATPGAGPGNLDYSPFGQPFTDAAPEGMGWKFYLWDAPCAACSGAAEGAKNMAIGAAKLPLELALASNDVSRATLQAGSLASNAMFGTSVYQYEPSSGLFKGMDEASKRGPAEGGKYIAKQMTDAGTLGIYGLADSAIDAVKTGDSTQYCQNAGAFAASVAVAKAASPSPKGTAPKQVPNEINAGRVKGPAPNEINAGRVKGPAPTEIPASQTRTLPGGTQHTLAQARAQFGQGQLIGVVEVTPEGGRVTAGTYGSSTNHLTLSGTNLGPLQTGQQRFGFMMIGKDVVVGPSSTGFVPRVSDIPAIRQALQQQGFLTPGACIVIEEYPGGPRAIYNLSTGERIH